MYGHGGPRKKEVTSKAKPGCKKRGANGPRTAAGPEKSQVNCKKGVPHVGKGQTRTGKIKKASTKLEETCVELGLARGSFTICGVWGEKAGLQARWHT